MAQRVRTKEELGEALKRGDETIEIEGNLKNQTLKIKANGNVAWGAVFLGVSAIVAGTIVTLASGGTGAPAGAAAALTGGTVASIGGISAAGISTLVGVALSGGGMGALKKLRSYKIVKKEKDYIVLKK